MTTSKTVILVVVILIVVAVVIVVRSRRRSPAQAPERSVPPIPGRDGPPAVVKLEVTPDKPAGFGYKNAWLAIKTDDPKKVAESLKLQDVQPANWRTGLATSYEHYQTHVFITAPVQRWVFVVGLALPDCGNSSSSDKCTPVLEALGQTFDSVFFFGTHRVVEFHAWARVDKGRISRAYAYLGEQGATIWNKGEKTKEEEDLVPRRNLWVVSDRFGGEIPGS